MLTRRSILALPASWPGLSSPAAAPLHRTVELDVGESAVVRLADGSTAKATVMQVIDKRDSIRNGVRQVRVQVKVNGEQAWLVSGNYRLPVEVGGIQVDCPATSRLQANASLDLWGLSKEVRLRLWPGGSAWIEPGTFDLPLRMRWFASDTQMTNEPTYVNGGDWPELPKVYYHNDLDFGGAEGLEQVTAATDGLVVSVRNEVHPEHRDSPARARPDVIYIVDERGWYYRYSHHQSIDPEVRLGERVRMGQRLGVLGKEGGAGWTHLHFGIQSRQPSGKWGVEDAYPFAWQAYVRKYRPAVIAVARPHHLLRVGEEAELDGTLSWSSSGAIRRFEWIFTDGSRASGARVRRKYAVPGTYSETLQVTDARGNRAWDFAVVQVIDPARIPAAGDRNSRQAAYPPAIHAVFWPTVSIRPKQEVVFRVFTFRARDAEETWDFGDGSANVRVRSTPANYLTTAGKYAEVRHGFNRPGDYIVAVTSRNGRGETATARLWVPVRDSVGQP